MANSTVLNRRKKKNEKEESKEFKINNDKGYKRLLSSINNLIGQANLTLYGTDRTSEVDSLNDKFQSLLHNQITDLITDNKDDVTSFLNRMISNDNKSVQAEKLLDNQFLSLSGENFSAMQSFIYDAYRNKLLEQYDIHQISSQLIELSEAILITRDAIVSADIVEGRMSRSFKFDNIDTNNIESATSIIEHIEKKFKLLEKIKNFIIPKTLEYGEYYVYIIPYSKLFSDFQVAKNAENFKNNYCESTLMESFVDIRDLNKNKKKDTSNDFNLFIESAYNDYTIQKKTTYVEEGKEEPKFISKEDFKKDMENVLKNITISNQSIPLPYIEEGSSSIEYLKEFKESLITEANKKDNLFNNISSGNFDIEKGIVIDNDKKKKKEEDFSNIRDCYIKMIEPTRIIPLKIMNTTIGYYYIMDEDITPLNGAFTTSMYASPFDEHRKEKTIIDNIAKQVVKSFDKKFLEENVKFKELIMNCISYYNLNEKKVKFQFIPVEYMQEFKIDEDVDGNGTSMIKKSLFYAKLYLMLLLFKIMSIIMNSNDTKVNYIRQSGISKDVSNKIQEIARLKQSKQISITDLFSYTSLINKVGGGQELYIPTGRNNERPMETEILSGQDVQLNSDLLEMLKNAYILGTGVPAAIVNYMNEADFAKVIEQNNTKFNGRVVNYQLDFNSAITDMYKKILLSSTNLDKNIIDNFEFILQPPKTTVINTKSELIGQFTSLCDFLIGILYEDPQQSTGTDEETADLVNQIREFKKAFAKDQLPMINFDEIEKTIEKVAILVKENKVKPKASNGDNGDDLGLSDDELSDENMGNMGF